MIEREHRCRETASNLARKWRIQSGRKWREMGPRGAVDTGLVFTIISVLCSHNIAPNIKEYQYKISI